MTTPQALLYVSKTLSLAIIFQTIEMFQLRSTMANDGVWRWGILREKIPAALKLFFEWIFPWPNFLFLLSFQLIAALSLFFMPCALALGLLFFTVMMVSVRWRGSFNGGADSMTLLVLLAVAIAYSRPESEILMRGCLWYIAIQCIFSYFISGLAKFRHSAWRRGEALLLFLSLSQYQSSPRWKDFFSEYPRLAKVATWGILSFEILSPLALLNPQNAMVFMSFGLLFHAGNFLALGLNRFFWIWLATYPALYYCAQA